MKLLKFLISKMLDYSNFQIIYRNGSAIGDQLCLTAVVEHIRESSKKRIILFTSKPEIFYNNESFYKIFSIKNDLKSKIILKILKLLNCKNIIEYRSKKKAQNNQYFLKQLNKKEHLAVAHINDEKLKKNISNDLFCKIKFSSEEINRYEKKFILPKKFAVVQSETKTTFTENKNWNTESFQYIIDNIKEVEWYQIGYKEKKLNNTIDYTENTNLREFAYIISKANFVVCLESLYNHVASAFQKKVFMIVSGFIPVEHVIYRNTIPIQYDQYLECKPCYLLTKCPIPNKPCTNKINPSDVVEIIKKNL